MKVTKIFAFGAVTALAGLAPVASAAEAEVKASVDTSPKIETRTEIKKDKDVTVRTDVDRTTSDKIQKTDKASGLLGMEVRNKENQKLGEIKDLVLDVHSGKVAYSVLSVGGFLGIREKLIALPPNALHVSDSRDFLILDADKSRIMAAPGFAATSWPSLHDPEISAFWKTDATGAAAGSEVRQKTGKTEVQIDKNDKIYTDADKDKNVKVEIKKD